MLNESVIVIREPKEFVVITGGETSEIVQIVEEKNEIIEVVRQGLPGADGAGADTLVIGEIPNGLINGVNATFTVEHDFVPESVDLFVNGLKQKRITEFNTVGNDTITLAESPLAGEIIQVNYIKV